MKKVIIGMVSLLSVQLLISPLVWLPDLRGYPVIIVSRTLGDRELCIFQVWNGDGYITDITVKEGERVYTKTLECDGRPMYSFLYTVSTENNNLYINNNIGTILHADVEKKEITYENVIHLLKPLD